MNFFIKTLNEGALSAMTKFSNNMNNTGRVLDHLDDHFSGIQVFI